MAPFDLRQSLLAMWQGLFKPQWLATIFRVQAIGPADSPVIIGSYATDKGAAVSGHNCYLPTVNNHVTNGQRVETVQNLQVVVAGRCRIFAGSISLHKVILRLQISQLSGAVGQVGTSAQLATGDNRLLNCPFAILQGLQAFV